MTDHVPTFYGHPITPKLTKEQQARVIELLAEGMSVKKIAETLQVGENRVRVLKDKTKIAEAQALLQATKKTPQALANLREAQTKIIELLDNLTAELGRVVVEQRKMNKALYRRATENKHLRQERAKDKAILRDLKKFYHNKTGREWL